MNWRDFLANIKCSYKKVICTNYAKTLIVTEFDNLSKAGLNIIKDQTLMKLVLFPKNKENRLF